MVCGSAVIPSDGVIGVDGGGGKSEYRLDERLLSSATDQETVTAKAGS
jgi:hypothetical protein